MGTITDPQAGINLADQNYRRPHGRPDPGRSGIDRCPTTPSARPARGDQPEPDQIRDLDIDATPYESGYTGLEVQRRPTATPPAQGINRDDRGPQARSTSRAGIDPGSR